MFGKYNLDIEYKCCGDGWKGKCSFFKRGKEGSCKYSKDRKCTNKKVTDFALVEEYNKMVGRTFDTLEGIKFIGEMVKHSDIDFKTLAEMFDKVVKTNKEL